jgi:major membrane immunogen (membrane-anchored lipoprotein)
MKFYANSKKIYIMKKITAIAFAATLALAACNDSATTDKTTVDSTKNTSTVTTYTPVDGDVRYEGKKVMVMRNGGWVEADADVKLDNGVTVYRNGRVERGDYQVELRDGEVVNRTGDFFDRTGNAVSNAWEATKEGASDAGRAVKKGLGKVGDKIEGVLDGDRKGENKDK